MDLNLTTEFDRLNAHRRINAHPLLVVLIDTDILKILYPDIIIIMSHYKLVSVASMIT